MEYNSQCPPLLLNNVPRWHRGNDQKKKKKEQDKEIYISPLGNRFGCVVFGYRGRYHFGTGLKDLSFPLFCLVRSLGERRTPPTHHAICTIIPPPPSRSLCPSCGMPGRCPHDKHCIWSCAGHGFSFRYRKGRKKGGREENVKTKERVFLL